MNTDMQFDRLVDGELDEQERRALLTSLDNEPDGWRRCALAFLESQCWKESFPALREPSRRPSPTVVVPTMRKSPWQHHAKTLLAMAACFLVAFYVGSLFHETGGELPISDAPRQVAATTGNAPTGRSLQLPTADRVPLDPPWLQNLPPAVPEDVMQAFHRTGHQVDQQREFVPVSTQDGRHVVVPVDHINVRYVGNGPY